MNSNEPIQKFPINRLIPAPDDPADWGTWREFLIRWREEVRASLGYDDRLYGQPEFAWVSGCFVCAMIMVWDQAFYDPETHVYRIEALLESGQAEFGGYDAVVLWHAYPNLGFDDRNQFDFFRDMPGGLPGLRDLSRRLHERSVKVFIAYNPWDTGTRREARPDIEVVADWVQDLEADGIFLDTLHQGAPEFRAALDARRPGVILEAEGEVPLENLHDHHMSWGQWFADSAAPGVLRNKWVERRHMSHQIRRWNVDHTDELHSAWMNGAGVLVWENVFGSWVGWCARDRSILRAMLPVQRRYQALFTDGQWTPLIATSAPDVYASEWSTTGCALWTLINRSEADVEGELFGLVPRAGYQYFDLMQGREAVVVSGVEQVGMIGRLPPRGVGAFLALPSDRVDPELMAFLQAQAQRQSQASSDSTFPARAVQRREAAPVPPLSQAELPVGMAVVHGGSVSLEIVNRVRECGFEGAPSNANCWWNLPGLHKPVKRQRSARLTPYAIGSEEVTNRQFQAFLERAGYAPSEATNFLRHWKAGAPPPGEEDLPVVYVALEDARAYAAWTGCRLPSEDEWQYALVNGRAGYSRRRVWNWTESEQSDGRTRFCVLKGGADYQAEGSVWYADGGPQAPEFGAKYLLMWPGMDRSGQIGFRCAATVQLVR